MGETSIIGGCGSTLCLSCIWPYCFRKQWGIRGLLRSCPCFTAFPCCKTLCSTSSSTLCDCGWIGENDDAYFGTDAARVEEVARERATRMAVWANRIAREREREQEQERARILDGGSGGVKHGVGVGAGVVGQRVHGMAERIPHGFFGHAGHHAPGIAAGAGAARPTATTAIANGGERNLDDVVGGHRLRAHRPGSAVYGGPPGGVETLTAQKRETSRTRGIDTPGTGGIEGGGTESADGPSPRTRQGVVGTRGTIASQTVIQRQYGPAVPMTIPSSLPRDNSADAPPVFK